MLSNERHQTATGPAIVNNPAERALRPIGIGRNNWLLAEADTGAETLAVAMTINKTAKLNGLNPQAYFADFLDRIHDHRINKLNELLPWNWLPMAAADAQTAGWRPSPMSAQSTTTPKCWARMPNFFKRSSTMTTI